MFKKILQRLLFILIIAITGTVSGYASAPWLQQEFGNGKIDQLVMALFEGTDDVAVGGSLNAAEKPNMIKKVVSAGQAVESVKKTEQVADLLTMAAEPQDVSFTVYQRAFEGVPIWIVKVVERGTEHYPAIWLFKVNGYSGRVLNLTEADLRLAGIKIGDSRREVEQVLGKADKITRGYDGDNRQTLYTMEYNKLTVVVGSKKGVTEIITSSSKHSTPRGLVVGDRQKKLIQLYGEPDVSVGGIKAYSLMGTNEKVFFVKVKNDKVTMMSAEYIKPDKK